MKPENKENLISIIIIFIGFAIEGINSFFELVVNVNAKALLQTLVTGLVVAGILNLVRTIAYKIVKTEEKTGVDEFLNSHCLQENCWHGVNDCLNLKNSDKSISIAHPSRKTLGTEKPILEIFDEIDIVGFGQTRLRDPFQRMEMGRQTLIDRLLNKEVSIRILAPIVKEKYFKYKQNNYIAETQGEFESKENGNDECKKIKEL